MAVDSIAAQSAAARTVSAPPPPVADPDRATQGTNAAAQNDDQDLSFWDVLDIVNPLQHIPVVNSIYRAVTGDQIKPAMQIGGDILFGGVVGGITSIANAVLQQATGKDVGGHVLATLGFGDDQSAGVQTAQATPANANAVNANAGADGQKPALTPLQTAQRQEALAAQADQVRQQGQVAAAALQQIRRQTQETAQGTPQGTQGTQQQQGMPPAGGLSGGLAAAAARAPQNQGFDPTQVMNSGHVPAKMPKRDAMLTTNMPRGSQAGNQERGPAVNAAWPMPPQQHAAPGAASAGASAAAGKPAPDSGRQAAAAQPIADPPASPPRDAMAEIMMRNLAKYQAEKRAQNPTLRTSG